MKNFWIYGSCALLVATAAWTAQAQEPKLGVKFDLDAESFRVVAPVVYNLNATGLEVGTIVYDVNAGGYKGVNQSGGWDTLTPPAAGTVVTAAAGVDKVTRALVTLNSGCAISNQSGTWITFDTYHNGATNESRCEMDFVPGTFSSAPVCVASANDGYPGGALQNAANAQVDWGNGKLYIVGTQQASSSGGTTGTNPYNGDVNVICVGPN